jgi:hypothetical protein
MDNSQQLLTQVFHIYDKNEQAAKLNGDRFNVFEILNRAKHENSFSSLIAELLNPEGTHGCKDIFLRLFYKHIIGDKIADFDSNIKVSTEYFIGFEKEDYEESEEELRFSGRIDILIQYKTLKKCIIIENKIDAPDKKRQLLRYWNYGKKTSNDFVLLYLTLDGKEALPCSAVNLKSNIDKEKGQKANYYCLSYKADILRWLEACIKETHAFPIVRETLRQYIFLIRKLTNQSTTQKMGIEIQKLISQNYKNYAASEIIAGEFDNTKKLLLETFWQEVITEIKTKFGLDGKIEFKMGKNDILDSRCPSIFILTKEERVWIGIEPLNGKHFKDIPNELFIGILDPDGENNEGYPFKNWRKILPTDYDFSKETLVKIIDPLEREVIKLNIVGKVLELMNEVNNTVQKFLQSDNEIE